MIRFGLVAEGKTDIVVLDNILYGYFNDSEGGTITTTYLQPNLDETSSFGSWYKVLEYCQSDDFKEAFGFLDYLVIQIDSDICEELGITQIGENQKNQIADFVALLQTRLIDRIGNSFYERHADKIIFAISVHSIECWLLPVYADRKKADKIMSCLDVLNRALAKSKKNTRLIINPANKDTRKYDKLSKPYLKQKILKQAFSKNASLELFIENLEAQFSSFSKETE